MTRARWNRGAAILGAICGLIVAFLDACPDPEVELGLEQIHAEVSKNER